MASLRGRRALALVAERARVLAAGVGKVDGLVRARIPSRVRLSRELCRLPDAHRDLGENLLAEAAGEIPDRALRRGALLVGHAGAVDVANLGVK